MIYFKQLYNKCTGSTAAKTRSRGTKYITVHEVQQLRLEVEELIHNCTGSTAAKNRSRGTKYRENTTGSPRNRKTRPGKTETQRRGKIFFNFFQVLF